MEVIMNLYKTLATLCSFMGARFEKDVISLEDGKDVYKMFSGMRDVIYVLRLEMLLLSPFGTGDLAK